MLNGLIDVGAVENGRLRGVKHARRTSYVKYILLLIEKTTMPSSVRLLEAIPQ